MYLAMLLIGGFMFLSFPFLVFEKRKYKGGKEKIKCISDLYNACSDYCDCAYLDRIEGIDVESVSSGIYGEVCYG